MRELTNKCSTKDVLAGFGEGTEREDRKGGF